VQAIAQEVSFQQSQFTGGHSGALDGGGHRDVAASRTGVAEVHLSVAALVFKRHLHLRSVRLHAAIFNLEIEFGHLCDTKVPKGRRRLGTAALAAFSHDSSLVPTSSTTL